MASMTLYPPIVNDYMPAFQVKPDSALTDDECPIDFSLSKFNLASDVKQVQISITKQSTGLNMLKTTDTIAANDGMDADPDWLTNSRYRATGILLLDIGEDGLTPTANNIYTASLFDSDLDSYHEIEDKQYTGFVPGEIYKVQIRLSTQMYGPDRDTKTQAQWLKENASYFSEWSTVCVVKSIGDIKLDLITLGFSKVNPGVLEAAPVYPTSSFEIIGNIDSQDETEILYSYRLKLLDANDNVLEDSGMLTAGDYNNINKMEFLFGTELQTNTNYSLVVTYTTNNGFSNTVKILFVCQYNYGLSADIYVAYLETSAPTDITTLSALGYEEDEGRIGLLLVNKISDPETAFTGTIYVRRTDSKSDFSKWEDFKIIECNNTMISDLGIFYDYTIESGIWYQYAIQILLPGQTFRSPMLYPFAIVGGQRVNYTEDYALRDFNYSFLLGENNKQLKLKFDNTMGSFKIQVTDSKTETIGGRYPTIARNTAVYYKTFPINGLISFQMDENQLFCTVDDIYKNNRVRALYEQYRSDRRVGQYDYVYEKEFRNKVLEFLHDGKIKLFKSPTEGNIIVRLMDVNLTPNQTLGRMIYSFTSNASEIAEDNIDNYVKYKFLNKNELEGGTAIQPEHIHANVDNNDSPNPPQNRRVW